MTVSVMTMEPTAAEPIRDVHNGTENERTAPEPTENDRQILPYAVEKTAYFHGKRRKTGRFGDILFVQLVLSVLLAVGVWAGGTFGGEELRSLCAHIKTLFG